jgi:preprotein translocase subunit SecE
VSDEGNAADDAASDGGGTEDTRSGGGRTAVVTKPVTRPQRPTGKRSRQRMLEAEEDLEDKESPEEASDEGKVAKEDSGTKKAKRGQKSERAGSVRTGRKAQKSGKAKKPKKTGDRSANPIVFVYNYLKQVVAEMRKVIWPNRKQMLTYTSVVLVFLAFMVALVGLTDFGLTRLVLLVFG